MKLELVQVAKEFSALRGKVEAVRGIDLIIGEGEFFVLLGPSGCGKSTLLNLIAGLEKPSAGEIRFDGRLVASPREKVFVPPREREVAMVFQSYALYPHLDVFDNIAFPLKIARMERAEIEKAVRRAAETLEITDILSAKPGEISGGQRQRVAIARAIVRRPRVLLLDEPLSNLDMQLRISTRAELKRLQRELGFTAVYVTHDQTEAMTLGDRIAVLKKGAIEQVGTPDDLYRRPANPFVAGFVGVPPMNLFRAEVKKENRGMSLLFGGQRLPLTSDQRGIAELTVGEVLVGLRPEHIRILDSGGKGEGIEGMIDAVEPMGRETLLHVRIGGEKIQVLTTGDEFHCEELIALMPDPEEIHIFPL
ncbi:ABC transporter ATP-binding protein [Desulfuromonas sp. TF]|uniref:ABC transporter ATP-binding protein n=1 Tax=Desulfuromonas sp. TF TaxID=1232410 RepID=UPI0003FB5F40|nr:ABC transporter ATP-binding protein [Desulfuromonas sp. TF]